MDQIFPAAFHSTPRILAGLTRAHLEDGMSPPVQLEQSGTPPDWVVNRRLIRT